MATNAAKPKPIMPLSNKNGMVLPNTSVIIHCKTYNTKMANVAEITTALNFCVA